MLFTAEPLEYAMIIFSYLYSTPPPICLFSPIDDLMYSLLTHPHTFPRYTDLLLLI